MAYRSETEDPNRSDTTQRDTTIRDTTTQRDTLRVVSGEGSGNAVWFIAGAVVIALVLVAIVVGTGGDSGPMPATMEPATGADVDVTVPGAVETAPAADGEAAPPAPEEALPPATEEPLVPGADTAN